MKTLLALFLLMTASTAWAEKGQHDPVMGPGQLAADIALYRHFGPRMAAARAATGASAVFTDVGNIAVMEDDGTLVLPPNTFDLDGKSVLFTPNGDGTYQVKASASGFDQSAVDAGKIVALADDDFSFVSLGFNFPFYKQSYGSVFLNSDGNLTFTTSDVSTTDRDLGRFLGGAPRVAPFFQDLNPSEGGKVVVTVLADRAVFSWVNVPLCCIGDITPPIPVQTFQATLFADGRIQLAWSGVQGRQAVVGISPGHLVGGTTVLDLSQQTGASAGGALAETFLTTNTFCFTCVMQRFYSAHDDAYDLVLVWANFSFLTGNAFSVGGPAHTEIAGIQGFSGPNNPLNIFDVSRDLGSKNGRLQGFTEMNNLGNFPSDPQANIFGVPPNNTLSVMGQEVGHRWLVSLRYPFNGDPLSNIILGRDDAHWSFFFNSEGSVVEGNSITDNGNGTFTTGKAVFQYGTLDQYVMGLIPPEQVNPSFVVINPRASQVAGSSPQQGVLFSGTRLNVTMDGIIQSNGQRWPPAALEQKDYNFAFILVGGKGNPPSAAEIAKLDGIRTAWEAIWPNYTSGRSKARTSLMRGAGIYPLPAAAGAGSTIQATLTLDSPAPSGGAAFQLQSADPTIVSVPASVTVAAGATQASFTMQALKAGITRVSGTSAGYQPLDGAVQVVAGFATVNGAGFAAGAPVTPGGIASLFGTNLASAGTSAMAGSLPLPTSLGGSQVTLAGKPAPLFFVSPSQINFQVPFEVQGVYVPLVITSNGTSTTLPLLMNRGAPGIFTLSQDGKGAAAVLHAADSTLVTAAKPARAGEFVSIFATGLGEVAPTVASGVGAPSSPLSMSVLTPVVKIGGLPATVSFSGLAPTFVGLYQLNVQIPSGVSGTQTLVISVRGVDSNAATIAVQ